MYAKSYKYVYRLVTVIQKILMFSFFWDIVYNAIS